MTNTAIERAEYIMMAVPIAANNGVGPISGDFLMFGNTTDDPEGNLAGVASNSLTPPTGIVNPEGVGVQFIGAFFLSVQALDGISPASGVAIHPGDRIYASGGTYDATTGCTYGCTLDANASTGIYIGNALDAIPSGQTATIRVRLKVTG
jgi:hypothetical protein